MAPPTGPPAITVNYLVQQANWLSDRYLERLIELLTLLLEARQLPPIQPGQSAGAEKAKLQRGKARIELKYIPDSRGSGAVYGPYQYLRYFQGNKHRSLYLGKGETDSSTSENLSDRL